MSNFENVLKFKMSGDVFFTIDPPSKLPRVRIRGQRFDGASGKGCTNISRIAPCTSHSLDTTHSRNGLREPKTQRRRPRIAKRCGTRRGARNKPMTQSNRSVQQSLGRDDRYAGEIIRFSETSVSHQWCSPHKKTVPDRPLLHPERDGCFLSDLLFDRKIPVKFTEITCDPLGDSSPVSSWISTIFSPRS